MTHTTPRAGLLTIGDLSRSSGIPIRTIRFYCDEGLLQPTRTAGGHRLFDRESAARLLLLRQLRALGIGLGAIRDVVEGQQQCSDVVAATRAAVDRELATLAWRRASLQAVEDSPPNERTTRLDLLSTAQDRGAAYDAIVGMWNRLLATFLPRDSFDGFVAINVPHLPRDPDPTHVVAFAELARLARDDAANNVMAQQIWRTDPHGIQDRRSLVAGIADACGLAANHMLSGVGPGRVLDQFVDAHANARGVRDSPEFRRKLVADAVDDDHRIRRYWELTGAITGEPVTSGAAHLWLHEALAASLHP